MTVSLHTSDRTSPIPFPTDNTATGSQPPPALTTAVNDYPPARRAPQQAIATTTAAPGFKEALGDKHNLKNLGDRLIEVAERLGHDATPQAILAALKTTSMTLHPDSTFGSAGGGSTTLESFIQSQGASLPPNHFALTSLADAVIGRSQEHPLGSLGGALNWPAPLDPRDQRRLRAMAMSYAGPKGEQPMVMQTKGLLLEFLRHRTPVPAEALKDPVATLNALISSPEGQQMGKTLQEQMQGITSNSSTADYLLAAMTLQMDPESMEFSHRNNIAGFNLDSKKHFGKTAAQVLGAFSEHLVTKGKTSPELAGAGAHLLLASRAPIFLIKDVPPSVTYGSPAWANLAVAVATIEARTPGKVPSMTFAQVMLEAQSAGQEDQAVTANAQREALTDWGVANGVVKKKFDPEYSAAELNSLVTTFNARKTMMATATQALDKDIPSRKEMALAKLKERFPDLEALFEEKVIYVHRQQNHHHHPEEIGTHSLLDIAMMDLPDSNVLFRSADSRMPLAALNANPSFGVAKAFETQFKSTIEEKKQGINTSIKHLISQLPSEDRRNFEFGKVSLYQTHSHTLGLGFNNRTVHPKSQELVVKTERGGVTTAYEINFNSGCIQKVSDWRATPSSDRKSNRVTEIKVFTPANGASDLAAERALLSTEPYIHNAFDSPRTQLIADAFVEHINLDDDAIKQAARGLTTADKNSNRAEAVNEFLLDLIPFRSAINNFRKGNIGAGLIDLSLDLFGILTAGAATAGKVLKIAGTAASAASKVARAAKTIGMATFSALNPLGGLGDLAVNGVRLTSYGFKKLVHGVNYLRGASGGYDLLKAATKAHGPTLIGSFTAAERSISTVAVLKNDQWYHYNPIKNEAYGLPIKDFKPIGSGVPQPLNALGASDRYYAEMRNNLVSSRTPPELPRFNQGYRNGNLQNVPGYSNGMSTKELRVLASQPGRTAEEMGILSREIKKGDIADAGYASRVLYNDVHAPGVQVTPVSQMYYLAHVDIVSKGECAGLSNAMALAIHQKKEGLLMQNLYRAAGDQALPNSTAFIQELRDLQDVVGRKYSFHMGKPQTKTGYQDIIDDLTNSPTSKTLRIGTKDHGMIAGIQVEAGKIEWFFYEPNSGMVKFTTLQSMQEGMEKVLNSGGIAASLSPYGSKRGAREYYVSTFDPSDMNTQGVNNAGIQKILDTPI